MSGKPPYASTSASLSPFSDAKLGLMSALVSVSIASELRDKSNKAFALR